MAQGLTASYFDALDAMNPPYHITQFHIGGPLVPRSLIEFEAAIELLMDNFKLMLGDGGTMSAMPLTAPKMPVASNSAYLGWRTSAFVAVYGV
ncbi:hypothetical protein GGR53DRAFT_498671 [Hypoxylon sp. FL1150]|nr:hypothetical protein GGR53DRAFT_498671 [Hypoxylon sp. FL1150]